MYREGAKSDCAIQMCTVSRLRVVEGRVAVGQFVLLREGLLVDVMTLSTLKRAIRDCSLDW